VQVTDTQVLEAVRAGGGPIEQIGALFMLHPETVEQSAANGYPHPFAGYFAGRGGVLGRADASTVNAVFAVFEPTVVRTFWEQGLAVHGAEGGASVYNDQIAGFARKHLAGAEGLDRIVELGEKVIAAAPELANPLFAGWRAMPRASDDAARALQVLFVLRELRGGIHMDALALSGLTAVEAHMLNKGSEYCAFFGWAEPFADGEDKRADKQAAEEATDRRMAQIVPAALTAEEATELTRLAERALDVARASAEPADASSG
jgi:hypothetical protein